MKHGLSPLLLLAVVAGPASAEAPTCEQCTAAPQHPLGSVRVAAAEAPAPASSSSSVSAAAAPADQAPSGLAVGIEVGEPTSATAGWFAGKLAIVGAIGTGTFEGPGVQLHADVQLEVTRLSPTIPLRVGLGGRFYHHGYTPGSVDELPDSHYGVRASVGAALERGSMQLYAELAPGIDVLRTRSCTLASGPSTVCPHAQELPLFVNFVVGARWFISN